MARRGSEVRSSPLVEASQADDALQAERHPRLRHPPRAGVHPEEQIHAPPPPEPRTGVLGGRRPRLLPHAATARPDG